MTREARTLPALLAAALLGVLCLAPAARAQVRSVPSRPAALAVTKIKDVAYLNLADIAKHLEAKGTWTEARKKYTLTGPDLKVELESDEREAKVNGLRIQLGNPIALLRGQLYLSRTDYERTLIPLLHPGEIVTLPATPHVIVLDPGHGEWDPGKVNSALGLTEKVLTLDVALRVRNRLEAAGYKVVLTRTDDKALAPDKKADLRARADLANAIGADLFISIHFNSLGEDASAADLRKTSGSEIFVFTPAGQRSSESWSSGVLDIEKDPVPANQYDAWSSLLANAVHRELLTQLRTSDRGQKTGHLGVLRWVDCPAILVESAFLSNDEEARKVATPAFRDQIADSIVVGVTAYTKTVQALRQSR